MADPARENHIAKMKNLAGLMTERAGPDIGRIIVVGAGDGLESSILAEAFGCQVVAIDIDPRPVVESDKVIYMDMDARAMTFANDEFDLLYSYHVLEHIENDKQALSEMARVLKPGATYMIGTPNKQRVAAYFTSAPDFKTAMQWNLVDWKAKLTGKFGNEHGAHAGYTLEQLLDRCRNAFGDAHSLTDDYYLVNYPHHLSKLRLLAKTGLWRAAYPSVYVTGRNSGAK